MTDPTRTTTCAITGRTVLINDCLRSGELRPSLLHFIQKRHPGLKTEDWISRAALPDLKAAYVEAALSEEIGELGELERNVIESLKAHEIISANPEEADDLAHRTFGERVADQIARFGGSWHFILSFGAFLLLWLLANTLLWTIHPPDPYPFILLNLILSCIAALQAPVIMMSQNRQEARDRKRAEQDYQINLKAELEIRHLHEKVDHLLHDQSQRLLEIQQIQTELLRQLVDKPTT
ncbi:MAG: DUF1003 domain-containing protein [Verrucomicrobiales bacterium]|nr:DUF1003 domain-containing protein [Verrucomicrobiae bacterium]MCP5553564.1 DUF1003 domain-containing protein [Akkermansiaceae bacterium]